MAGREAVPRMKRSKSEGSVLEPTIPDPDPHFKEFADHVILGTSVGKSVTQLQ